MTTVATSAILRTCHKCKKSKYVVLIVKDKKSVSGHSNICKECNNKYYREKAKLKIRKVKQTIETHLSGDQIAQKMHEFYYNLGCLPSRQELQVLKSDIGIKKFAITKEFKKQFELHYKKDNPKELRAKCPKCIAIKYLSEFRPAKSSIYGIGYCKECTNQQQKQRKESNQVLTKSSF